MMMAPMYVCVTVARNNCNKNTKNVLLSQIHIPDTRECEKQKKKRKEGETRAEIHTITIIIDKIVVIGGWRGDPLIIKMN
jgi:hypothetical protein